MSAKHKEISEVLRRQDAVIKGLLEGLRSLIDIYALVEKSQKHMIDVSQHLGGQSLASMALLRCLIATHPEPAAVLEKLLVEMDQLGDRDLGVLTHLTDTFQIYVKELSLRTGGAAG
jgi:hypothetical protein